MTFVPPESTLTSVVPSATDWVARSNLTPPQRGLWLGQKLLPDSPLYNMAFLFTLSGKLEPTHFQAAFQALIDRCDAFRTVIVEKEGVPQQKILTALQSPLSILDFSQNVDPKKAVRDWAEACCQRRFNLSDCLFDTALIRLNDETFVWYLNQHHLITDMVSLKRSYDILTDLYQRSIDGTLAEVSMVSAYGEIAFPETAPQAADYWQQQPQNGPIPLYHRTALTQNPRSRRVTVELDRDRTIAFKELALTAESAALTPALSLFNLVAGIFLAYLYRISGSSQIACLTPAHGRTTRAHRDVIGVFMELFPLQVTVNSSETFASLLTQVREASSGLLRYAQPGASELISNRSSVNAVLNFLPATISDFAGHAVRAEWLHTGSSDPQHHLRLVVHDFDNRGCLQLHFDFNSDLFEPDLQDRAPGHFLALLDAMLTDRSQLVSAVTLANETEQHHLQSLSLGHPSSVIPWEPPAETVVQQFEAQVQKTPDEIAITQVGPASSVDSSLTYQQLNSRINQLAHLLQQRGIVSETRPETCIGICLPRSIDLLIALWAVLKAGGTYVPLDPNYPEARMAFVLSETQVSWVLTQSQLASLFSGPVETLTLDTLDLSQQQNHNLNQWPQLNQRAYILYTSGSTGQPKGVEIEHRSLANYVQWAEQQYVRGQTLAFPLFSPLTFDLTVTSIYVPLLSGGQVIIYPDDGAAIDLSLQRIVQDNLVDVIKLTPSHLALVQGQPWGTKIKALILGGENLKTSLAQTISANRGDSLEIYNEYGPTEATVGCMIHRFEPLSTAKGAMSGSVPIGKPVAGTHIYLLDQALNLVPQGDVGEIFIGGPGLARGYLNQVGLTQARFIHRGAERLYRTGDLAFWNPAGQLVYLGRNDRQVKLNSIRIELGEIESILAFHPDIQACAVTLVQSEALPATADITTDSGPNNTPNIGSLISTQQLVAYYVGEAAVTDLKTFLARQLPSNWVPLHWVSLNQMPLTAHGKVDWTALPEVQSGDLNATPTFVAPKTPQELQLAKIWQQVLGIDRVGRQDNFFDLGGDSILAIRIAARLTESGYPLSPNLIFQHSTLEDLAQVLPDQPPPEKDNGPEPDQPQPSETRSLIDLSNQQLAKLSGLLEQIDQQGVNH